MASEVLERVDERVDERADDALANTSASLPHSPTSPFSNSDRNVEEEDDMPELISCSDDDDDEEDYVIVPSATTTTTGAPVAAASPAESVNGVVGTNGASGLLAEIAASPVSAEEEGILGLLRPVRMITMDHSWRVSRARPARSEWTGPLFSRTDEYGRVVAYDAYHLRERERERSVGRSVE